MGDRVWVNIPKTGYVGVGEVIGERRRADEFHFATQTGHQSLLDLIEHDDYPQLYRHTGMKDDESAEFVVPVRWLYTVSRTDAFSEVGLFGNQNTVCKPITPKWSHTVGRLQQAWRLDE
ncbi:MAG: hypothetical protein L0I84_03965 [Halomonas subglaciescola]|nr:hypothetical protein [Halomonas subglaciescola]